MRVDPSTLLTSVLVAPSMVFNISSTERTFFFTPNISKRIFKTLVSLTNFFIFILDRFFYKKCFIKKSRLYLRLLTVWIFIFMEQKMFLNIIFMSFYGNWNSEILFQLRIVDYSYLFLYYILFSLSLK